MKESGKLDLKDNFYIHIPRYDIDIMRYSDSNIKSKYRYSARIFSNRKNRIKHLSNSLFPVP